MKNKRRKREHPTKPKDAPAPLPSSTTTMSLQRGDLSILSALAAELPDVLTAEILQKLDVKDILNLAQVSKWCRDVVWSVGGVRSLEAKLKVYAERNLSRPSSWLGYAAVFGNMPAIKALLESGVDANKSCNPQYFPLYSAPTHLAAEFGHSMIVKLLIDAGVDVNKRATMSSANSTELVSNVTALNLAATWDQAPVIMELVKAGADVNIADNRGRTPINNAAEHGNDICVGLLVAYDADINIADKDGITPMKRALKNDYEKIVKLLKYVEARNRV
jgi:ankyrin repeat protein